MSSGFLLLLLWSFTPSTLDARSPLPIDFPSNIVVEPELRAIVSRLWVRSPTFRAQSTAIGANRNYRVAVLLDPVLSINRSSRALCVLRVYSSGLVTARITVPAGRNADELIPHEFEHVVEHVEGINVRQSVGRYGSGIYDAGAGRIETLRATQAGRKARAELLAGESAVAMSTRR